MVYPIGMKISTTNPTPIPAQDQKFWADFQAKARAFADRTPIGFSSARTPVTETDPNECDDTEAREAWNFQQYHR